MFCTKKIKVGSHLKAVKTSTSKDYDLLALNFDGMVFKDDVGWPKNINVHSSLNRMLLPYATSIFGIACVVGGISCTSALVFMAKPYEGTGEESSWNPACPDLCFFCVCTTACKFWIGWEYWIVNQMLIDTSYLPQGKWLFSWVDLQNGECKENQGGSFGFSIYPQRKQKNYTKGRTGESR